MKNENKFRTVNRILGDRPRLGPFPADKIFPWSVIGVVNVFVVSYTFQAGWLATGLSIAWGWATWLVVSTNKDFLGKFIGVPRISRGYMPFKTLKKDTKIRIKKEQGIEKSPELKK